MLHATSLISGSRTTGHLQAFPLPSAVCRNRTALVRRGWLLAQAQLCPGDAVLGHPEMGKTDHHQLCRHQGRSSQESTSPVSFLHCTSQGFCTHCLPFPQLISMPSTLHRVSDPFAGAGKERTHQPCLQQPSQEASAAPNPLPRALQPLLSSGVVAPPEADSSGALSEIKTFLQVLG